MGTTSVVLRVSLVIRTGIAFYCGALHRHMTMHARLVVWATLWLYG